MDEKGVSPWLMMRERTQGSAERTQNAKLQSFEQSSRARADAQSFKKCRIRDSVLSNLLPPVMFVPAHQPPPLLLRNKTLILKECFSFVLGIMSWICFYATTFEKGSLVCYLSSA
jgi:hypothetical protein